MSKEFRQYKESDFDSCVELVKQTWNLHGGFDNIPDENIVYQHYFMTCLNWNEHLEVLIEDNVVKGVLFGSIENESISKGIRYKKQDKALKKWTRYHLNKGNFGDTDKAVEQLKKFSRNDALGEKYAYKFDSEINLFIVSPELRGQGYGIQLMDHYIGFCKNHKLKSAFLWTDLGCSYSFYEKYGFELYKKFDCNGQKQSGMIFSIQIDY